jgi:hypothetical protein
MHDVLTLTGGYPINKIHELLPQTGKQIKPGSFKIKVKGLYFGMVLVGCLRSVVS